MHAVQAVLREKACALAMLQHRHDFLRSLVKRRRFSCAHCKPIDIDFISYLSHIHDSRSLRSKFYGKALKSLLGSLLKSNVLSFCVVPPAHQRLSSACRMPQKPGKCVEQTLTLQLLVSASQLRKNTFVDNVDVESFKFKFDAHMPLPACIEHRPRTY